MKLRPKLKFYSQEILSNWHDLKTNRLINVTEKIVLLSTAISLAFLAANWKQLPPAVPLWYSRPWGIDRLAHPLWLLVLPLGSLFLFTVNILTATLVTRDYPIFTRVLFLSSLLVSFLSLLALIKIILLVT